MSNDSKRPVTVEDLLHFKRAERPRAEFWTRFDEELRAKQLAALVRKEPWWQVLPSRLRVLARFHLPLGAAAVLAVTLVSIREYQPAEVAAPAGLSGRLEAAQPADIVAPEAPAVATVEASVTEPAIEPASTGIASLGLVSNSAGELARMVPTISPQERNARAEDLRPSARSIAVNRAAAEAMLGIPANGFEARALPVFRTAPAEPLAQMSSPAETRRSRFASAFAAAAVGTSPAPTARVARRLSDEQLYDSIHRFGASGNSVSIRF